MAERFSYTEEVVGSNPAPSTGEVPKWTNGAVSKTAGDFSRVGSNPTLSAESPDPRSRHLAITPNLLGKFRGPRVKIYHRLAIIFLTRGILKSIGGLAELAIAPACPVTKRRGGRIGKALVLKTSGYLYPCEFESRPLRFLTGSRKTGGELFPLQVRVLHPPKKYVRFFQKERTEKFK